MDEARPKASEALATRGEARFQTKEYDKIESDLLRAVRLLEYDLNKFKGQDIMKARRKLAIYHDIRARAKHRLNQIDDHHEAHEKAIAQYRAMVDAGERRYLETLFIRLETLSREYWDLNATETAIEKVLESIERLEAYSTEFPTDQNLKLRRFRLKGTLALLKGDYDEAEREFFNGINFLRDEILKAGDAQKLSLLNDFTYRASGLLLRHKEVDPDSIYEIYKAALQAGDLFKINHGVSADLVKYEFSVRLNQGEKMISLGEPIDKVRGFMEQIIKDSQSETNFNLEGDIREKVKMMALYVIGSSHPDDLKAVAQQGLQIAESLDQRGQLSTDQQAYLGAFEEMLQRANKSDDLSNQ